MVRRLLIRREPQQRLLFVGVLLFGGCAIFFTAVEALSSPTTSTTTSTSISLNQLLSTCVHACQRGCHEIRKVERQRQAGQAFSVSFKDDTDPKSALTEADARAQYAIVRSLTKVWGDALAIVGEEDDEDEENGNGDESNTLSMIDASILQEPLRKDLCLELLEKNSSSDDAVDIVNLADITVFVDPVDGTREFVEGRLSNCQALVGIAWNGTPVAGAIGIPFPYGSLQEEATVVYGQVGAGHGMTGTPLKPKKKDGDAPSRPIMASGDATIDIMVESRTTIIEEQLGGSNQLYGGAGNKILATALGYVDCTVQHKYGGPWDTCAPEAILRSMGGRITDLRGRDLVITKLLNAPKHANRLGFVATGKHSAIDHDELINALKQSKVVQAYVETSERI